MEERVAEMEARTEAITELNRDSSDLERDFLDMEADTEVEAELAALKAKVQADNG
jgi:phage shock protein A